MEQARRVKVQDVLTINEIITLLTQQRKEIVACYPTFNWMFSFTNLW